MKISQIGLVGLICLIGIVNFFYLKPPVVNWDEGTHALWGFKEWLALHNGNIIEFLNLTRLQFSYPPLGSWIIALVNLPSKFSLDLARFSSTLGFIVGGIFLVLIARVLSTGEQTKFFAEGVGSASRQLFSNSLRRQKSPTKVGANDSSKIKKDWWLIPATSFISLFLFLTSPAILFYSVTVFKESWGTALTLLTLYLYFKANDKTVILGSPKGDSRIRLESDSGQASMTSKQKQLFFHSLTGFSLTLLFFEKYNYAVLLGLVLGLEGVVEGVFNGTNLTNWANWFKRQLVLFLPFLLFASWWILTPDNKLPQFLDILRSDWNPVTLGAGNSWQYLTFFVQSIRASYTFSNVLFLLIAICYLLSLKDLWQKKIRVLWLFFTLNFVLGTLHAINLQDRYILTSVPALFLLVGYELPYLSSRASKASVAIYSRLRLPRRPSIFFGTSRNDKKNNNHLTIQQFSNIFFVLFVLLVLFDLRNFPQYLKANATHMLLSAMYNETDYKDTLFDFNQNDWPKDSKQLTGNGKQKETPEQVLDYLLNNVDITKPINYLGWTAEISPDWVELRRQMALRNGQGNQSKKGNFLVTIEVKPSSRLYTYDYKRANLWQLGRIGEIRENWIDRLVKEKEFKELGVAVRIYLVP